MLTVSKIETNKLEEYKAWKAIGLRFYPYADFLDYGTIRQTNREYNGEFLKEMGLTYTTNAGTFNEFAELSAKVKYVVTKQDQINENKQNVALSKYEGDTLVKFNADMTVQLTQNGETLSGTYTLNNGEAVCTWSDGDTDVFVKGNVELYNKDSAINTNNKTFYLYEIQGNNRKLDYESGNYQLSIWTNGIDIRKP